FCFFNYKPVSMTSKLQLQKLLVRSVCVFIGLLIFSVAGQAQERINVSGIVKNTDGELLSGVSVRVQGQSQAETSTNVQGAFNLTNVPLKSTLTLTYVGYQSEEIIIQSSSPLSITLMSLNEFLDDVVVIGYGTQRKGDVTSSVASVKKEDFTQGAVKDVGQLIQGKVAGLGITNPNGDPAGGTQVRLRGTNSMGGANTNPLVLIDGIPGDLSQVAPEDVESVDVLKDGSAAAIYGTRGTNGVILITTRQGGRGEINAVEYDGYMSTQQISRKLEMLNASEFRELYPDQDHGGNTDWLDEITRK